MKINKLNTNIKIMAISIVTVLSSCTNTIKTSSIPQKEKIIIYQVMTRLFGNDNLTNKFNGTLEENGVGKFNDFTTTALDSIRALGANYIWYTGVIAHGSKTDYSKYGIPQSHPGTIKGNAGSPYAIRDYYDVNPCLATDINNRMGEYESLIERTHASGLKVIMDFVPNHVARQYNSIAAPKGVEGLGKSDNINVAFNPDNNFYYIPNKSLKPTFNTQGYKETPAKATGNDVFTSTPSENDWYETIKLNYGVDYSNNGKKHFNAPDSIPSTWIKMRDILLFWGAKNIDGFRTDMAEMVPVEFWEWAIPQVKERYPQIIFIAEIYNPKAYLAYIQQGKFDYLYDKVGLYDTLKSVIQGRSSTSALNIVENTHADSIQSPSDIKLSDKLLNFLENHDEQRIAHKEFAGTMQAGIPMSIVSACYTNAPFMLYFGQELGEQAIGEEGFGGDDGRTTIFDYYGIENISKWRNGGKYNGAEESINSGLTTEQKELREFYKNLLNLIKTNPIFANSTTESLPAPSKSQFAFVREQEGNRVLCVVNFAKEQAKFSLPINGKEGKELLNSSPTANSISIKGDEAHVTLAPLSGIIVELK